MKPFLVTCWWSLPHLRRQASFQPGGGHRPRTDAPRFVSWRRRNGIGHKTWTRHDCFLIYVDATLSRVTILALTSLYVFIIEKLLKLSIRPACFWACFAGVSRNPGKPADPGIQPLWTRRPDNNEHMNRMTNRLRIRLCYLLFLAPALAGCAAGDDPFPSAGSNVQTSWHIQATIDGSRLRTEVTEEVTLSDAELILLLRGAGSWEPDALSLALREAGAEDVECALTDDRDTLSISCQYTRSTDNDRARIALPAPSSLLLEPIHALPTQVGQPLEITRSGIIESTHPLSDLPRSFQKHIAGGTVTRLVALVTPRRAAISWHETWPAGSLPVVTDEHPLVMVWANYRPSQTVWWGWGMALAIALVAVSIAFPVRAHPNQPAPPPQSTFPDRPRFIRALLSRLARLVYWLQTEWPRLFLPLAAAALTLVGAALFIAAWLLAAFFDVTQAARTQLLLWLANLPLAADWPALTGQSVWPLTLLLAGLLLPVLGIGLGLRREWARLGFVALHLGMLLLLLMAWPERLLAPPAFPGQTLFTWVAGACALLAITLLLYAARRPALRLQFTDEEADDQKRE